MTMTCSARECAGSSTCMHEDANPISYSIASTEAASVRFRRRDQWVRMAACCGERKGGKKRGEGKGGRGRESTQRLERATCPATWRPHNGTI